MTEYSWTPTEEYIGRANVTRLGRSNGIDTLDDLRRASVADIGWYWDAVVQDLELPFQVPYEQVLDASDGPAFARWFVGGELNLAHACAARWASTRLSDG